MASTSPAVFSLPFSHYAQLDYHPIPVTYASKVPAGGEGWNTKLYDYAALDKGKYNIGLLCDNIVGLDIDIEDKKLAESIEKVCRKALGLPKSTPRRIGKPPKRLLIARVVSPMHSWDLMHREEGARGKTLFQLLGQGKQFVIHGIHPDTGKAYELDRPLPAWSDLPAVTEAQVNEMRLAVGMALIDAGYKITGTTGGQRENTGKFTGVRWRSDSELNNVLEALGKISPELPREPWFKVACSLHAGTHGDEDGFDLFHAWSSGELRDEPVAAPKYKGMRDCWRVWRGLKPGKGISTGTLFHMAESGEWSPDGTKAPKMDAVPIAPVSDDGVGIDLNTLLAADIGPVPWIVQDMLTFGAHLLVGRPKGGKSWITMEMAYAVGNGGQFLGLQAHRGHVLWIAAEDTSASLGRRLQIRNERARGITVMTMESLKAERARWEGEITFEQWLRGYLEEHREVDLVIMDTHETVEAMWNMEQIDTKRSAGVTQVAYQKSRIYDALGVEMEACIVLVHHSRKRNGKEVTDYHELINLPATVVAGSTASLVLSDLPDRDVHDEDNHKRIFATRGRHIIKELPLLIELKDARATLLGVYSEVTQTEAQSEVLACIEALLGEQEVTNIAEVAAELGKHKSTVQGALARARDDRGQLLWKGRKLIVTAGRKGGIKWA